VGRRSFKFMNLRSEACWRTKRSPGDPGRRSLSIVSAFGRSLGRTVSPTHAIILTERELISIREVLHPGDQERYGGVWDYVPLPRIAGLSISRNAKGLLSLAVPLRGDAGLDLIYEASAEKDLEALVAKISEIRQGKVGQPRSQ
jgi:hypothetical protein